MAISTLTRRAGPFVGNGVATVFPFGFKVFETDDIAVFEDDGSGVGYVQLVSGFSVALDANGGTVTLSAPLSNGRKLLILSNVDATQGTQITTQGGFQPGVIESALDKLTALVQQLGDKVARTFRLGDTDEPVGTLAGNRVGKYLAFDAEGDMVFADGLGADANLRGDLAAGGGSALVGFNRTGGTARSVQSKLRDRFDVRDFGVRARTETANEYTAEINAAILQAWTENVPLFVEESYRAAGTIQMLSGSRVISSGPKGSFFDPAEYPQKPSPGFYKPSDGLAGPLLVRGIGDTLIGVTLEHKKIGGGRPADGGVMKMGQGPVANNHNNSLTRMVTIIGHEIDYEPGGTRLRNTFGGQPAGCALVVFPATPVGTQRYWNYLDVRLSNGGIGLWFGDQANANIVHVIANTIYRQIWFDGGSTEVLGNEITGQWCNNYPMPTTALLTEAILPLIGSDPAAYAASQADVVVLTARNGAFMNRIQGYTETGGTLLDVDADSAAQYNDLSGLRANEVFPSAVPDGWSPPNRFFNENRERGQEIKIIPYDPTFVATQKTRDYDGFGAEVKKRKVYTENLPLGGGTNFAVNTSSRVFARWNQAVVMSKGAKPSVRAKLRVQVNNPGGSAGVHAAEVEFEYRCSDNATAAGELNVISVRRFPSANNYVASLVFIKGIAGTARPFALGITLGNFGAIAPDHVFVSLEFEGTTHQQNIVRMDAFGDMTLAMEPVTANDVTDAVSLLATGITAI